jgi:pimeloyl-ACP methyl ester carboxylesterase
MHYEAFGEGKPLLLLHGWSLDHRHMVSEMEPVFKGRAGWKRIYPDLPGHGRTPAPPWISDQDGMLEALLAFVDCLLAGQRFALGGMSAGAYLARGVLYHRASMIDGLLQTAPVVVPADAERTVPPAVTIAADPALLAELGPAERGSLDRAVVQSHRVLDALLRDYVSGNEMANGDLLGPMRQDPLRYGFSFDVDALPEPFPAPTLILTGRQDAAVGFCDAWRIVDNYPRATFMVLDRAGHLLAVDQQELFRALVAEWLDRVEEWIGMSQEKEEQNERAD